MGGLRGRWERLCARVARPTLLSGRSTSPLDVVNRATFTAAVVLISALGLSQSGAHAQAPVGDRADASQPSPYGGGDGLSAKTAVVIRATGEVAGIRSEYAWIADYYPGSKRVSQALTAGDDDQHKRYDIITIQTSAGTKVVLWFDISAMFQ